MLEGIDLVVGRGAVVSLSGLWQGRRRESLLGGHACADAGICLQSCVRPTFGGGSLLSPVDSIQTPALWTVGGGTGVTSVEGNLGVVPSHGSAEGLANWGWAGDGGEAAVRA